MAYLKCQGTGRLFVKQIGLHLDLLIWARAWHTSLLMCRQHDAGQLFAKRVVIHGRSLACVSRRSKVGKVCFHHLPQACLMLAWLHLEVLKPLLDVIMSVTLSHALSQEICNAEQQHNNNILV